MYRNQIVLLLYAFVALAIVVSKGEGIAPIAHAQSWFPSPNIQNQNSNNLQFNKAIPQPNTSKYMAEMPDIHNANVLSDILSGDNVLSSSPKISSNHDGKHSFNSCHKIIVSNKLRFTVPPAETLRYANVIKATSTPPIMVNAYYRNHTTGMITVVRDFLSPVQEICGTEHDDYIIGSEDNIDIIFGLRGNDIIMALGGDDIVFAGPGDDTVYGGEGNNQLFGGEGNDNLVGGTGDDLLVGGPGNDRLYGNTGDDILQGGQGADYFDCGEGLDTVIDYNPSQGDVVSSSCENVNLIH